MKELPVIIEIHNSEYNRHIAFSVNNLLDDEELQWRLSLAIKNLKKDITWRMIEEGKVNA